MPRANPDGAHHFNRSPYSTADINRDHVKLTLPETAALHAVVNEYQAHGFVDAHEFSVATRWVEKFGVMQSYDLLLQYATNPNVPAPLTKLAHDLYLRNMRREPEHRHGRRASCGGVAAGFRLSVAMLMAGAAGYGEAQDSYPSRPIRFVAPYPPDGSSDVLARVLAQKLTDSLGRQVIVENRPGAACNIGHEYVAEAVPDGYVLLLTTKSQMVDNPYMYKRLPSDP